MLEDYRAMFGIKRPVIFINVHLGHPTEMTHKIDVLVIVILWHIKFICNQKISSLDDEANFVHMLSKGKSEFI